MVAGDEAGTPVSTATSERREQRKHPARPHSTRKRSILLGGALATVAAMSAACGPEDRDRAPNDDDELTPESSTQTSSAPLVIPDAAERRAVLLSPDHPAFSEPAPDTFRATLETTRGDFVVEVVRAWAPVGADRFYNLARHGYYDDARFHRVVPGFITQWGVAGDPEVTAVWYDRGMPDDPVGASNERGTIAFAFTDAGTRSTQIYISMVDNSRLDEQGFAPFGRVVVGMEGVVDSIHSGYGEASGGGVRAGNQAALVEGGNAYLDREFPELDRLIRVRLSG